MLAARLKPVRIPAPAPTPTGLDLSAAAQERKNDRQLAGHDLQPGSKLGQQFRPRTGTLFTTEAIFCQDLAGKFASCHTHSSTVGGLSNS
ncbi:hypothetical protein [Kamptonema formosum]|uniref:hypothetical protein n=1 Tax=Kamptonema formosum TaxID=331992 RepID=UPI00034793D9|nr:hypothetical protein [Oscillatoria sp. PCC 10802]